jgi:hypothetical protein
MYFLTILKAGKSKIKLLPCSVSDDGPVSLLSRWHLITKFSEGDEQCPQHDKTMKGTKGNKHSLSDPMMAFPLWLNHLLNAPATNTITLRIKF